MKKFFAIVFLALISLALSATSVDLSLTGVTTGTHFYYCSTSVDSVIVYKPAGGGITLWTHTTGTVTADSVIITQSTQGYWTCQYGPTSIIEFYVNFVSISPTEPFLDTEIYKCPETTILVDGQQTPQPDFTYLWGAGETTASVAFLIPGMAFVTVTGACGEVTDMMEVINWPSPNPDLGADQLLCDGMTSTLDPGVFAGYFWTGGSTDPTLGVTTTGNYAVTVADDNGCQETDEIMVTFTTNPGQEILLVTIDTVDGNNRVTWETGNDAYVYVDIYREVSTDVYDIIGGAEYAEGEWTDDVSAINQSWRYKIELIDTCGNHSPQSDYHQNISTATVPIVGGGYRVEWTPYIIENGAKSVSNYYIFAVEGLGENWNAEQLA